MNELAKIFITKDATLNILIVGIIGYKLFEKIVDEKYTIQAKDARNNIIYSVKPTEPVNTKEMDIPSESSTNSAEVSESYSPKSC